MSVDDHLPVHDVVDTVVDHLRQRGRVVLTAEPGAGKTTVVPPALLMAFPQGRILLLQPRRVAARAVAQRLAAGLGEAVGDTVGVVTREDRVVGPRTRLEVMTEGILTARMRRGAGLDDVAVVIFDEFHERNLTGDTGLAMVHAARISPFATSAPAVAVMSATLDADRVARYLSQPDGDAPVIAVPGRTHPVTMRWLPARPKERPLDHHVRAVRQALREDGDVVVFLPGVGEIERLAGELRSAIDSGSIGESLDIRPLHGSLAAADQDWALFGPGFGRRIILATNIAETSLTVPGVSVVVDTGTARIAKFDPARQVDRLEVRPISRASAEQRSGRAGRTGPGVAIRCWSKIEHAARPAYTPPEVRRIDPSGWALTNAVWNAHNLEPLTYLDEPEEKATAVALDVLAELGAVIDRRVTARGEEMADLAVQPRMAAMIAAAAATGHGHLACVLATLLAERDVLLGSAGRPPCDLRLRVRLVAGDDDVDTLGASIHRNGVLRCQRFSRDLARRLGVDGEPIDAEATGDTLALAFPHRVATARGSVGRFQLEGTSAWVQRGDPMAAVPLLIVADADTRKSERRIRLAAPAL